MVHNYFLQDIMEKGKLKKIMEMSKPEFKNDFDFDETKSSSVRKSKKNLSPTSSKNDLTHLSETQKVKEAVKEVCADDLLTKSAKKKAKRKASNKAPENNSKTENGNQKVIKDTRKTDLEIDGVNYVVKSAKKKNKKISTEKVFDQKISTNQRKQEEELMAMKLIYKEKFHVEDELSKKYSIDLPFRGGRDARLEFYYPPEYPSDVPPHYTLTAAWVKDSKIKDISKELSNILSENFGQCIMYKWVTKIEEALKSEIEEMKRNPQAFEESPPVVSQETKVDENEKSLPEIYKGKDIWDRGSCFTPYLAPVTSEKEVRAVIEKIEDCRKVSTAWRNTYAYRYDGEGGKVVEIGEDGGEPKAGGNLLRRLINYNANNVIVFISRRFGGSMLGPDRFKHLNDAADDVLVTCGYKNIAATHKSKAKHGGKTEKDKESKKKIPKKKK